LVATGSVPFWGLDHMIRRIGGSEGDLWVALFHCWGDDVGRVIEGRDDNFMLRTVNALYKREIGASELAVLGIRQH
jgi:hypothetical protein